MFSSTINNKMYRFFQKLLLIIYDSYISQISILFFKLKSSYKNLNENCHTLNIYIFLYDNHQLISFEINSRDFLYSYLFDLHDINVGHLLNI